MSDRPILPGGGFRAALRVQRDVLGALILRELHTRFGRDNLGYVWLFIEPMILAGSIAGFQLAIGHRMPGGMSTFPFYILSYMPYYLLRSIVSRAATTAEANLPLFYHARVRLHDVILARSILDVAAVIVAMLVFLGGVGIATGEWPQDPLGVALAVIMMGLMMHGVACAISALAAVAGEQPVDRVVHPATYLGIPVFGAFFMVWWLPQRGQELLLHVPTVHVFEFIREAYYGPIVPYHHDLGYVAAAILVANAFGLLALRAAEPYREH
ncbi:ABC transporter permease [Roseococcus sp. DSY-14]|uniref:ABC transporter permease n=1 Tax=Roseococcus sp. DSY-14 TaxID=3369650 RepID=UPI00387AE45C